MCGLSGPVNTFQGDKKTLLPWYKQPLPSFYSIPRLSEIRQFFSYFLFSRTAKGAFTVPRSFFIRHYPDQIPSSPRSQPPAARKANAHSTMAPVILSPGVQRGIPGG